MSKLFYIILLISILQTIFLLDLTSIEVNGGNWGSSFKFIISGTTSQLITKSSNIPVDLLIGEGESQEQKEAKCSVERTESGQKALYSCLYNENVIGTAFFKNEENQYEISPFSLNIQYIEASNLKYIDQVWQYDLKGEYTGGSQIILGSISYMNIKSNDTLKTAGCSFVSKEGNIVLFNCKINGINQVLSDKIIIPNNQNQGTTFSSGLTEDKKIFIYKEVSFIEAKKLIFDGNKWKFLIIVPYQVIPAGTKSIVDILYNGFLSSATCISDDNSMLDCEVNKEGEQIETDLVKIHYIKSTESTITWNNLLKIYEIPIEKEIKYISSYELIYTSTKIWTFTLDFEEDRDQLILPENALVTIDIKLNDNPSIAKCYHQDLVLNCKTEIIEDEIESFKISHEKKDGSISWQNNFNIDVPITVSVTITYKNSYNLNFNNEGFWNFILEAEKSIQNDINNNFPFSIKIKIIKNGQEIIGVSYCYPIENKNDRFNCEVEYENQINTDLIMINGEVDDVSVIWNNGFEEDKKIILNSTLNFIKSYDLMYLEEKWNFKIKIDKTLPNGSKLVVDILYDNTHKDTATCYYNNENEDNENILSCIRDSQTQSPSENLILKIVKDSGSITWNEMEITEIKMPLTINKYLENAYGLYFDVKWNFYIDVENLGTIPSDAYFELDILQTINSDTDNKKEQVAICELSDKAQTSPDISTLFCHLDIDEQSRTDKIELNSEKKDGSINFSNEIADFEASITEAIAEKTPFNLLDAYNMEFIDDSWVFSIKGKPERDIYKGEVFIFDILYITLERVIDTKAKCWTNGGTQNTEIVLSCYAEQEDQLETGLIQIKYFQSTDTNLVWNGGIDDNYQITLKGKDLILVKAYGLTLETTWKFRIDIEGGVLPPGVQIVIDVIIATQTKSLRCTSLNNLQIICDTGTSSNTDLIKLSENNLSESSVKWIEKRTPDYLIYLNYEFDFISVYNLFFDITVNIWVFFLKKSGIIPIGSKLSVDILYNDINCIAICFYNIDNDELKCSVERESQNSMDLIQLNHIKTSESSITFNNLLIDEKISLICDLTLENAENLQIGPDGYWIFDLEISDEDNIPNYSKIIIDIYYTINNIQYKATAECYLDDRIFSCKTELESYELVTIKLTKTENSLSTVTWKNKEEYECDNVPMFIYSSSLKYTNFTYITIIENRYYFFVNLIDFIPKEGEIIIDIEIDGDIKTCICKAETITRLKCEVKVEDYKNNTNIFIIPKNSEHSTVSWQNLENNVEVNVFYQECKGAYDKIQKNETHYGFKILTSGPTLNVGTKIYVRINYVDSNGNIISSATVPCISEQEFLTCTAEIISGASDFNLYLPSSSSYSSSSSSSSNYYNYYDGIIWSNGNNQNTEVYSNRNLNLNLEINSFDYDTESNCYEFTFQDTTYTSGNTFFLTDIIIGGVTTYAYCTYENNNYFKCKTSRVEYNPDDEIKISSTKNYGSVEWNNISENKKISNLYFVEISHIYNLEFNNNGKWQFTVESTNELSSTPEGGVKLDILINGETGYANCVLVGEKKLNCEVDSTTQDQNSLIQLNYNVNGDIKFLNLENLRIPLNIELELNKIYDFSYNNYYSTWNFVIEAKIDEGNDIPIDSYITVDIKYNNNNDIAICTRTSLTNNNILTLYCRGKNEIPQNSMISLNQDKSSYSSISWKNTISEDVDIFISANLYVETMDNIIFNENSGKWSFDMKTNGYNYNYPLNSKVKIDILYNGVETTATCTYVSISEYKFSCVPDVESQNQVDTFEIINKGVNKQGTVTYSNPNQKLTLLYPAQLKFEFAYDLIYSDSKWSFKIKVSESNLSNGKTTLLYFKNYYDHKTALCLMGENNILSCESYTNSYYYSDESVYLTSYQNNKYVQWTNSFSDTPIYVNLSIRVISVSGIFANNVWKFVIKYENIGENEKNYYYDNHALLDILVNNEQSTALCTISYNNYLKCESNHYYQSINDIIKLPEENEPISGTIYLTEELTE